MAEEGEGVGVGGGVSSAGLPDFCFMATEMTFVPDTSLPFIAGYLPFCTSHWRCGWVYVSALTAVCFITSCFLAICCVKCCCKTKR